MNLVIGLSGSIFLNMEDTFRGYKRAYVNNDYVESIVRAGAIPMILPVSLEIKNFKSYAKAMIDKVDALVLTGGQDVNPYLYNEEPALELGEIFEERDLFDIELYKAAIEAKKPVFGVCRGLQLINVIEGGSLYQDLSYADFVKIKHSQNDHPTRTIHYIDFEENTFFSKVYDKKYKVNSFHHQIIKDLAKDFKICAKSADGVIEAFECINDEKFVIGVQYHPEMNSCVDIKSQKLFNEFIKEVENRKMK